MKSSITATSTSSPRSGSHRLQFRSGEESVHRHQTSCTKLVIVPTSAGERSSYMGRQRTR